MAKGLLFVKKKTLPFIMQAKMKFELDLKAFANQPGYRHTWCEIVSNKNIDK
jgi:hypothetical protein